MRGPARPDRPALARPVGRRGKSRLDDPDDLVRRELETALQRRIRIFPVLLGTAQVPAACLLPASLRAIATLQAVPLRDDRWRSDAQALAAEIGRILGPGAAAPPSRTASGPTPSRAERRQQVEAASRQIDAHLEYNKAALQTRREAVQGAIGLTRSELAASDRHTRSRERSMDQARKKLAAAPPAARESLLQTYARDDAAIAAQFTARGDALTRRADDLLNGLGALAVAPQPFPDLLARKPAPADPPRTADTREPSVSPAGAVGGGDPPGDDRTGGSVHRSIGGEQRWPVGSSGVLRLACSAARSC